MPQGGIFKNVDVQEHLVYYGQISVPCYIGLTYASLLILFNLQFSNNHLIPSQVQCLSTVRWEIALNGTGRQKNSSEEEHNVLAVSTSKVEHNFLWEISQTKTQGDWLVSFR